MRRLLIVLLTAFLAVAIHVDWHLARPTHHRLSLGWSQHWIFAVIAFAIVGWVIARNWPRAPAPVAMIVVGSSILLAQLIEPMIEVAATQCRLGFPVEPERWLPFGLCLGAGIPSLMIAISLCRPRMTTA